MDFGNSEIMSADELRSDVVLQEVPVQCQRCELAGILPDSEDGKWLYLTLEYMHGEITGKTCRFEIMARFFFHSVNVCFKVCCLVICTYCMPCMMIVLLPPAYEVSRRLCFQSFCPSVHRGRGGGGGEWVKIEKCSECHGKPKNALTFFRTILPLTGGGGPKF